MIALNMAPMELDCDVDGAIYRQSIKYIKDCRDISKMLK